MPKQRTYPGSIYADRGKLVIKFKGKKFATGLNDNKAGRQRAGELLEKIWLDFNKLGGFSEKNLTIKDAFDEFIASKVSKYQRTRTGYECAYKAIIKDNYYIDVEKIEKDIRYYLNNNKHSEVTINSYLTNIQVFLNFCAKKKWIEKTSFKSDYKVKEHRVDNEGYTPEECEQILSYFDKSSPTIAKLIRFQLQTGARIVDCLTLTQDQINWKKKEITWLNKITKQKEKRPVSNTAIQILKSLPSFDDNKLFPWKHSESWKLSKSLRKAFKVLGIPKGNRSFQEFRVTFRMNLLSRGIPLEYVMYLLRHKTPDVTIDHYTNYSPTEILKIINN